ncbi:replication factor A1 [Nematocida sp. AWRm77]|nr:replication factor A1 [Nematocida sp. AWRm77]
MTLKENKALEIVKGSIHDVLTAGEEDRRSHIPLVVRVVKTFSREEAIESKLPIVITDGVVTHQGFISLKMWEYIANGQIKERSIIRVGLRVIANFEEASVIYIREVLECSEGKSWESVTMSPSKRKAEEDASAKYTKASVTTVEEVSPWVAAWVLRIKVVNKTPVKTYSRDGKSGKVANALVMDKTGDISISFFNEQVDELFSKLVINKTYEITGGAVKLANRAFARSGHTYELSGDKKMTITPVDCESEIISVPPLSKISTVKENVNAIVNLVVIVVSAEPPVEIRCKDNEMRKKREIKVVDMSGEVISLTVWREMADMSISAEDVLLLQKVKVGLFQSMPQLSIMSTSIVSVNPEIPEAFALSGWYRNNKAKLAVCTGGVREGKEEISTIEEVKEARMERATIMGTVAFIDTKSLYYQACPEPNCFKKVFPQEEGGETVYSCAKCGKTYDTYQYRYNVFIKVYDSTSGIDLSLFRDASVLFDNLTANELDALKAEDYDSFRYKEGVVIGKEVVATIKKKQPVGGVEEEELKYTAESIRLLDYKDASQKLLSAV